MSFGLYKCYILRSDLYYYSHLVASINEALHTGDYTNWPELLSSAALLVWSLVTYWSVWSKNSELCKFKVPVGRVSTSRRQIGQLSVVYRWTVCGVCIVNRCFAGINACRSRGVRCRWTCRPLVFTDTRPTDAQHMIVNVLKPAKNWLWILHDNYGKNRNKNWSMILSDMVEIRHRTGYRYWLIRLKKKIQLLPLLRHLTV